MPDAVDGAVAKIADAILRLVARVPKTDEPASRTPAERARAIAGTAAAKAALAAGTLAVPPGPLGWVTLLPELIAVWRIQSQMIADIAAVYGKAPSLTREQMVYCLFRNVAAQAVRDVVVRAGQRFIVRRLSSKALDAVARKVGLRLTARTVGKGVARWLPVAGALGVAAYAFYDTGRVAQTANELFAHEIEVAGEADAG
jgi:hypothetical protein